MRTSCNFEGLGYYAFERVGKRPPRKGEYFLSGAVPSAYRAYADMNKPYLIVKPKGDCLLPKYAKAHENG